MEELGVIAIFLVCASVIVVTGARVYNRRVRAQHPPKRWTLEEHTDGEFHGVYCECPGEPPMLVGGVPWGSQDFEYQVEELRAKGRQRLVALNSGREQAR